MSKKPTQPDQPLTLDDVERAMRDIIVNGRKVVIFDKETGEAMPQVRQPSAGDIKAALDVIRVASESGRHDIAGKIAADMQAKGFKIAPVADAG